MASVSKNRHGNWTVRWRTDAGKQRSRMIPGPKANALKVKADLEARHALGHLYEAEPETLGAYLEGWLKRYGQRVRASTCKRRREALRALGVLDEREAGKPGVAQWRAPDATEIPVEPRTPGHRIANSRSSSLSSEYLVRITAAEIEDAVSALASHAPRQAQLALASLKLALEGAETRGQRFDARILKLKPPRYDEKAPRFLSWAEVEKLASFMLEHSKRIVPVAALTGLRQGELFGLEEADLELDKARLTVRRSGGGPTKTKASKRTVHLPPLAVELLREQLLARRHTGGKLVFPAWKGGRMSKDNFMAREFRPALRRAGLETMPFHALRHTFVSLSALSGARPEHIAAQLGHADGGALLLRRYRHLFAGELEGAALKLEALVRPDEAKAEEGAG